MGPLELTVRTPVQQCSAINASESKVSFDKVRIDLRGVEERCFALRNFSAAILHVSHRGQQSSRTRVCC